MKKTLKPRNYGRQSRAKERFDQIIQEATLILETAPSEFSTNKIAQRLNMSVGNLYQFFPNKHAILGEIIEKEFEKDRSKMMALGQKMKGEKIINILEGLLALAIDLDQRSPLLKLKILEGLGTTQKMKSFSKLNREMFEVVKGLLLSAPDWPKNREVDFYALMLYSGTLNLLRTNEMLNLMDSNKLIREWKKAFLKSLV